MRKERRTGLLKARVADFCEATVSPFEVLESWIGVDGKNKRWILKATSTEFSRFRKEYGWRVIPF